MEFMIWKSGYTEGVCVIKSLEIENDWELDEGKSRLEGFPPDVTCRMDPSFRDDIALADNLYGAGMPVISAKARAVMEQEVTGERLEFLPVQVINHKGRVASNDYFVLHPLDVLDCIDTDKSKVEWNSISPEDISTCEGLVLREEEIPDEFRIFRPRFLGSEILVRRDLVDALTAAELTGLLFGEAKDYKG